MSGTTTVKGGLVGNPQVDKALKEHQFLVLRADRGTGKTTLALQLLKDAITKGDQDVLFIAGEQVWGHMHIEMYMEGLCKQAKNKNLYTSDTGSVITVMSTYGRLRGYRFDLVVIDDPSMDLSKVETAKLEQFLREVYNAVRREKGAPVGRVVVIHDTTSPVVDIPAPYTTVRIDET